MKCAPSVFIRDNESYIKDLNPLKSWAEQQAHYLSKMTGDSYEDTYKFIVDKLKSGGFEGMVDPTVEFLERDENGDRHVKELPLSKYISTINEENLILAPSFTCYLHHDVKQSKLVTYLEENVAQRSVVKKQSFVEKANGNIELAATLSNLEKTLKRMNNALSGTFASGGTVLYNPSAHYSLTSTTRTVTSLSNANTERMSGGNRHYRHPAIVMDNIIFVTATLNKSQLQDVMDKYQLHIPTVDEVMDVILYSSNNYWRSERWLKYIRDYVESLDDLERAGFVYVGDLYHIKKYNPDMMRTFLERLSRKVKCPDYMAKSLMESASFDVTNLSHHICLDEIRGMGTDYDRMHESGVLTTLAGTAYNASIVLDEYKDFINAFVVTDNLPPSIAYFKDAKRKCTVLSDTDSTCASYAHWDDWFYGKVGFDSKDIGLTASVMTIVTQSVKHILTQLTANMNASVKLYGVLSMKNEYYWPIMIPMNVAKHYVASIWIREGNVYDEADLEKKGVNLIASKVNSHILADQKDMILSIFDDIIKRGKLSLYKYIKRVADLERWLLEQAAKGDGSILKMEKINQESSYKKGGINSPYRNYIFWQEAMAPHYGDTDPPPYAAINLPLGLSSPTKVNEWLNSMDNTALAIDVKKFMDKYNKKTLGSVLLPHAKVKSDGVPKELMDVINTDHLVETLMKSHYMLLESIGFYRKPGMTYIEMGY